MFSSSLPHTACTRKIFLKLKTIGYMANVIIPPGMVDPDFAKHQLDLMLRSDYLHPNGQLPAYE